MKQFISLFALILFLFNAGDVLAEQFVFSTIVVDRSLVMITLSASQTDNIVAEALIGSGMTSKVMRAQCEQKATAENINKALPRIADHLNKTKDTNLIHTLSSAGITGCKPD